MTAANPSPIPEQAERRMQPDNTVLQRMFDCRVQRSENGCWLWTGSVNKEAAL